MADKMTTTTADLRKLAADAKANPCELCGGRELSQALSRALDALEWSTNFHGADKPYVVGRVNDILTGTKGGDDDEG